MFVCSRRFVQVPWKLLPVITVCELAPAFLTVAAPGTSVAPQTREGRRLQRGNIDPRKPHSAYSCQRIERLGAALGPLLINVRPKKLKRRTRGGTTWRIERHPWKTMKTCPGAGTYSSSVVPDIENVPVVMLSSVTTDVVPHATVLQETVADSDMSDADGLEELASMLTLWFAESALPIGDVSLEGNDGMNIILSEHAAYGHDGCKLSEPGQEGVQMAHEKWVVVATGYGVFLSRPISSSNWRRVALV